jgi:hypothetical protein
MLISSASGVLIKDRKRSPTWITTTAFPPANEVYCSFLAALNWTKVYVSIDLNVSSEYYGYASNRVTTQLKGCGISFIQNSFSSRNKSFSVNSLLQEFNRTNRSMKNIFRFLISSHKVGTFSVFLYFGQPMGLRKILVNYKKIQTCSVCIS